MICVNCKFRSKTAFCSERCKKEHMSTQRQITYQLKGKGGYVKKTARVGAATIQSIWPKEKK